VPGIWAELKRKGIHLSGLIIPLGYIFVEKKIAITFLILVNLLYFSAEALRLLSQRLNRIFLRYFSELLREEEHQKIAGSGYYVMGALVSVLFFEKKIAIMSLSFLMVGDFFAALVGMTWGKTKLIGNKSLQGSLACFLTCLLISYFTLDFRLTLVGIVGSITATLVELFPLKINDNFAIPVLSGLAMTLIK
jgi:dolichol kinase